MTIYKGVVQGGLITEVSGTTTFLPFQDKLMSCAVIVEGELAIAETFSDSGVVGLSSACLQKESVRIEMGSTDLTWNMLQANLLTLATEDGSNPKLVQETHTLSTVNATPASTQILNYEAIQIGVPEPYLTDGVVVADTDGNQYEVSTSTTTGVSTVTFTTDETGKRVTFRYYRPGVTGESRIRFGQDAGRMSKFGVWGKLKTCGKDVTFIVPHAVTAPNLNLSVADGTLGEVSFSLMAVRENGYFMDLIRDA